MLGKATSLSLDDLFPPAGAASGPVPNASPIKRMRDSHHNAARLVALGHRRAEVSSITGYSTSHLATLAADQSFIELVSYYSDRAVEQFTDVASRMGTLGLDAISEIQARLSESGEDFTVKELLAVAELTLDRTGHGPQRSTQVNLNHGLNTDQLNKIRNSITSQEVIDITSLEEAPATSSESEGTDLGGDVIDLALAPPEAANSSTKGGTEF